MPRVQISGRMEMRRDQHRLVLQLMPPAFVVEGHDMGIIVGYKRLGKCI